MTAEAPPTSLTFEVPLPYRALSSNGNKGGRWARKSGPTRQYRRDVAAVARSAGFTQRWEPPARVTVTLEYGVKGSRATGLYAPRDESNAISAFKAGYDGLVDAGIVASDSRKHMHIGGATISSTWGPGVRVTITADAETAP